jgi:ABC-type phosphate/phosphonate transport system substrate-binding protein
MLAAGDADLACIDSWSLALIERERPELVAGLHRVGLGPWIPSPAVAVRADVSVERGDQLAVALADAIADDASSAISDALLVDGFVPLTIDDYLPVLELRSDPS